nr:hypothetical protein [Candidatus Cloacimonadota bacterium]
MTSINKLWILILSIFQITILNSSAFLGGAISSPQRILENDYFCDRLDLQEGDLMLRRGCSFVSTLISQAFPRAEGMSHCGIVVKIDGSWKIIHSISGSISDQDGIRIDPISSFASKAQNGKIYHIKPIFEIDRNLITEKAKQYLKQNVAFDHDFDLDDPSKMYCSELVRAVYLEAGSRDVFIYKNVAGKSLVDLGSFFNDSYWNPQPINWMEP